MVRRIRLVAVTTALLTGLLNFSLFPQSVVVQTPGERDLKRTAHRLRIPPAQLKNARLALRQAHELALRAEPEALDNLSELVSLWSRLDRQAAAPAVDALVGRLRAEAASASDATRYQHSTQLALGALSALVELAPEKAVQLVAQWPTPPPQFGPAAESMHRQMQSQFQNSYVQRITHEDPEEAAAFLARSPVTAQNLHSIPQLANQLAYRGKRDQGLRLIDQAIDQLRQSPLDFNSLQNYSHLIGQMTQAYPERSQDVLSVWLNKLQQIPPGGPATKMQLKGGTLELSAPEQAALNLIRGLANQPELAMRTLGSLPELRSKIDALGGLDAVLNPFAGGPRQPARGRQDPYQFSQELLSDLRGKATSNPALAGQKLAGLATTPEGIQSLLILAEQANHRDPDLSLQALQMAETALFQVEPLEQRAGLLQRFLQIYQRCEGEVPHTILKQGFQLLNDLRQKQMQNPQGNPDGTRARRPVDFLELALLTEWARIDFAGARSYIEQHASDLQFQFRACTGIASGLSR